MRPKQKWLYSISCLALAGLVGVYQLVATNSPMVVRSVPMEQKLVAITIDDGPYPKTTEQVLTVLQDKGVKATFFILGVNAEKDLATIKATAARGHEIANHAYSHRHLSTLSRAEAEAELDKSTNLLQSIGCRPVLFRPPGGAWNDAVAEAALKRGQTTVLWSVDSGDWRRPPVGKVVKTVLDQVKPGSIILFHDGQPSLPTPAALAIIIDKLREQGYEFVTVSELLTKQKT